MHRPRPSSRRSFLKASLAYGAASAAGGSLATSRLSPAILRAAEAARQQNRHVILLWMPGGPSQLDTFDMKPGAATGGPLQEAQTNVPGIRFSEHLPRLAKQADRLAILRGMSTAEGDHARGTTLMQTGHPPGGPVKYPAVGCTLSRALAEEAPRAPEHDALPAFVSIAPGPLVQQSPRSGFLGPQYAPMTVDASAPGGTRSLAELRVNFLDRHAHVDPLRQGRRVDLWRAMQDDYLAGRRVDNALAHDTVFQAALDLVDSDAREAFDLTQESAKTRAAYGEGIFGQGCLMARRLLERDVPLVEVSLGNGIAWDTHADNFAQVQRLCGELDQGWATLMDQLETLGLLESTTILWAGEFGRTPLINDNGGRDHYPQAFSCVLAGGGVAGGQVYGATSADGSEVEDGKMNAQDLLSTLCGAIGVSPHTQFDTADGRPIAIAEGQIVRQVLS